MRVNMSATGSLILPARFGYTWDQPVQRCFAECQTRAAKFPDISPTAPAHRAAVHQPCGTRIARQLLQTGVILLPLELRAQSGVFLHRRSLAPIALQPCFLGH